VDGDAVARRLGGFFSGIAFNEAVRSLCRYRIRKVTQTSWWLGRRVVVYVPPKERVWEELGEGWGGDADAVTRRYSAC
jgi:hypothetical protein